MPDITIHISEQPHLKGYLLQQVVHIAHINVTFSIVSTRKDEHNRAKTQLGKSLPDAVKSILVLMDELDR